ncbi:putative N-succinyldiaminopimelate aminotransferase DapC [Panicum miliaceum]|uniref:N-succinyldiaminopimelate aminotransferase DapC n=1 Tax=Panicum miliaceum TaxID=4540 RepID=A0A3L6PRX4_PANMI|nr:putative N-succinyldiaminopimelate aminotransferase DapC [Panicum miliaceum]
MLAIKHGAINLGQGFPNFDGPDFVKEAAIQAINAGKNQYARGYEFCEYLIREVGVVVIPPSVFYLDLEEGKKLVGFTFCKDEDTLRAAVERMKTKLRKK